MTVTRRDILRRAGTVWFWLLFLGLFAWLDWITHREIAFIIVVFGITAAIMLLKDEIVRRFNLEEPLDRLPKWSRPFMLAAPGLIYFLIRGSGTSGAGPIVLIAALGAVAVVSFFGRQIDGKLIRYYDNRNRFLPQFIRMPLAILLPIAISFLIIHGHISDLPALWGGTTAHRKSPAGLEGRFFLATLLAAAFAFLLVREPEVVTEAHPAAPAPPQHPAEEHPAARKATHKPGAAHHEAAGHEAAARKPAATRSSPRRRARRKKA